VGTVTRHTPWASPRLLGAPRAHGAGIKKPRNRTRKPRQPWRRQRVFARQPGDVRQPSRLLTVHVDGLGHRIHNPVFVHAPPTVQPRGQSILTPFSTGDSSLAKSALIFSRTSSTLPI